MQGAEATAVLGRVTARPRGRILVALMLGALAILPFSGALRGGFVFDDHSAILKNPRIKAPLDIRALLRTGFWGEEGGFNQGSYRPLAVLSFIIDDRIGGGSPAAYHATNLVLHGVVTALVFLVLLSRIGNPTIAFACALVFGLHALHTENVAGIVGRADVLAAALVLSAWSLARKSSAVLALAAAPVFLLALLAKETAAFLIVLVALEDLLKLDPERRQPRRVRAFAIAALASMLVVYTGMRLSALGVFAAPVGFQSNPLVGAALLERILTPAGLLARATSLLVLPLVLSADYSYAEILPVRSLLDPQVLAGLLLAVGLPIVALLRRRRAPVVGLAVVFFLISYAPVSNTVLLIPTIFAERLLYLPSVGFCLLLAALGVRVLERGRSIRIALSVMGLLLVGHGARAAWRTSEWRSQRTLFESAIAAAPQSARAWQNLGVEELNAKNFERAVACLTQASTIAPQWSAARSYLGIALDLSGHPQLAERHFAEAVRHAPTLTEPLQNLVYFWLRYGQIDRATEAVARFRGAGGDAAFATELTGQITKRKNQMAKSGTQERRP